MKFKYASLLTALICLGLCAPALSIQRHGIEPAAIGNDDAKSLYCSVISPLEIGELVYGDNSGQTNNATYYSCILYAELRGGEDIYEFTVTEAGTYTITLTSETCDEGLILLNECSVFACIGLADNFSDGTEWLFADLEPGTYTVVVDGFFVGEGCPYYLSVSKYMEISGTDRCDVENLVCLEPTAVPRLITGHVSWSDYNEDYGIDCCGGCLPSSTDSGPEAVFVMAMNDGDSFEATLYGEFFTFYLTDDCNATTCLAGAGYMNYQDPYGPFPISYTHEGTYSLLYLLVANNSYDVPFNMIYTRTGDCAHPIANEAAAWGAVKTMYR